MGSNIPHPAHGGTVDVLVHKQLFAPGKQPMMANFLILTGQTLKKGSILGAVSASGKLKLSTAAAGDGSEVPVAILGEDLDTTSGDKLFAVYVEGTFNEQALVYGAGHDANSVRLNLRKVGIYLQAPRYSFVPGGA